MKVGIFLHKQPRKIPSKKKKKKLTSRTTIKNIHNNLVALLRPIFIIFL